jgi:hypothetical protein
MGGRGCVVYMRKQREEEKKGREGIGRRSYRK